MHETPYYYLIKGNDGWWIVRGMLVISMASLFTGAEDFYFLMDPEYFISTHLQYTNNNLATSESCQLLNKPVDLETFIKSV